MMADETYICAVCREEFAYAWSEAEAIAEMKENFGDIPPEGREIVCDDCFKKLNIQKN